MSDTQVYQPGADRGVRRKEKVVLAGGAYHVWVWSMTVSDSTQIMERATRPETDRRGGKSEAMSVILQIQLSCYAAEEDGAKRIWDDSTRTDIYLLPAADMFLLLEAINRVNGMNATEDEIARDFSRATGAVPSSD